MNDTEAYERARDRAEKKLGFYKHLAAYVVANGIMIAVDLTTSPDKLWFFWPLGGWGIGLLLHGLSVFKPIDSSSLKQKMIDSELERERGAAE